MKRRNFQTAMNALDAVSNLKGVKFAFTILKNKKIIEHKVEEEKDIFAKVLEMSERFKEFEEKRVSLCVKYSTKDENGNPITTNEQYDIVDKDAFKNEYIPLMDEYKDDLEARNKQMQEYENLLDEEIEIEFKKVDFNDLPEDLTSKQLEELDFMINLD